MNEWLFILHCLMIIVGLFAALAIGKEALISFVAVTWLLANFCVTKQIFLFGCEVTASDMYSLGALLGISVIQELFDTKAAKKTVLISFLILFFASLMSVLHLNYLPSPHDTTQAHFTALLSPLPKLMVASLGTFLLANILEIFLLAQLRRVTKIPFALSTFLVTSIVALFDTILFTMWGLSNLVDSPLAVCMLSFAIKMVILLILTPFLTLVHRIRAMTS